MDNTDKPSNENFGNKGASSFDREPMWKMPVSEPLTKRERFAMAAMQGLCAKGGASETVIASESVAIADALLTELEE